MIHKHPICLDELRECDPDGSTLSGLLGVCAEGHYPFDEFVAAAAEYLGEYNYGLAEDYIFDGLPRRIWWEEMPYCQAEGEPCEDGKCDCCQVFEEVWQGMWSLPYTVLRLKPRRTWRLTVPQDAHRGT